MEQTTMNIPVLALRGLTVFPGQTTGFDVEREISMLALNNAMEEGKDIFLVTQRELSVMRPDESDLYTVGTVAHVLQIIKTSETTVRGARYGQGSYQSPVADQTFPAGQCGAGGGRFSG